MKIPGPDHPITIEPTPRRVRISVDGVVIAETDKALTLKESTYPPVQYIPRADANQALLSATDHHTYCPYKGDASYLSINTGKRTIENAIWSYEDPYDAVKPIAGHLAFYSNKVTVEELS